MDINKKGNIISLINNLKIVEVFKDKDKEERVSITDLFTKCYNYLKQSLKS